MIADNIPEIAQARRLGHQLTNRIVETYSHVASEVERRLLRALEHRWRQANRSTSVDQRPPERAPHIDPGRDTPIRADLTPPASSRISPSQPDRTAASALQPTPEFLQAG
jgi:hypothetical protein